MLPTISQIREWAKETQDREQKIWDDLRAELMAKYIAEGYYMWWAEAKANREVLELRSRPKHSDQQLSLKTAEEVANMGPLD